MIPLMKRGPQLIVIAVAALVIAVLIALVIRQSRGVSATPILLVREAAGPLIPAGGGADDTTRLEGFLNMAVPPPDRGGPRAPFAVVAFEVQRPDEGNLNAALRLRGGRVVKPNSLTAKGFKRPGQSTIGRSILAMTFPLDEGDEPESFEWQDVRFACRAVAAGDFIAHCRALWDHK